MGFFKLGKIDRAGPETSGKDRHEDAGRETAAGSAGMHSVDARAHGGAASGAGGATGANGAGGGASSGSRAVAGARGGELSGGTATGQEKSERKKKQTRQDDSNAAGGGASSGVASSVNDFISKTKSQRRKGLKPSGPELIAYARYLGIDPVADHDLLWIAVEALEAPLPNAWTEHFDSNDRVFYYNATTRVSSWTHPLEQIYRDTYTKIVNFRNSNLSPAERGKQLQQLQAECEQMEKDVHREIGLWTEHEDEHGHRFYFNSEEKLSSWTDPRPAKCHILYLKMKLVRNLASGVGTSGFTAGMAAGHAVEASRFAPLSPRKEQEGFERSAPNAAGMGAGAGGATASDLGTKRPKVGADQSDSRRGSLEFCGNSSGSTQRIDGQMPAGGSTAAAGGHSARGGGAGVAGAAGGASVAMEGDPLSGGPSFDESAFAGAGVAGAFPYGSDTEVEIDRAKKKKKKEKKKRDLSAPGDTGRVVQSLNHSQSEPSVVGKAPPPKNDDGARNSLGPYPSGPQFPSGGGAFVDNQSESLSTIGRTRVKAGIRLAPISGGNLGGESHEHPAASPVGPGLMGSSSVPELKPLF